MPTSPFQRSRRVIVLGGGIAGIAAALNLLDAGSSVTLVEARGFLGGRAFSFMDGTTGQPLDNGQHVFFGCCTRFIGFLERLGVRDQWYLQERLRIPVLSRSGRVGELAASLLPAPLAMAPSLLTYPHLSLTDKLGVMRGILRARFTGRAAARLEDMTFYQWLRSAGQSERAINTLWNPVVESALNDNVRDVSAAMGLMVVREGMLSGPGMANMGYPRQGLRAALGDPAEERLRRAGSNLILNDPVRRVEFCKGHLSDGPPEVSAITLASGQVVRGDTYVSALPFSALLRVLPPEVAAVEPFRSVGQLQWSPILNLHIRYDRAVMDEPFCAVVDGPLRWVFNRDALVGETSPQGQVVTISVSAAWEYMGQTREELAREFVAEMAQILPGAGRACALSVTVVKQREAAFRCLPGAGRLRPGPLTPVANLYLAGEWTNTGWPSTMEGAVRSGYAAADAVIQNAHTQDIRSHSAGAGDNAADA